MGGGGSSDLKHHYYKLTIPTNEPSFNEAFNVLLPSIGTFKISQNDGYVFITYGRIISGATVTIENMVAFEFVPVTEGHIYLEYRLAKDLKDYQYLYSLRDDNSALKLDFIIDNIIEITEEEYYNSIIN